MRSFEETIKIEGQEVRIPEEAREQINDKIHDVLREDHGIETEAVFWLEPVSMTECEGCGYIDVRRHGTQCPQCGEVMK